MTPVPVERWMIAAFAGWLAIAVAAAALLRGRIAPLALYVNLGFPILLVVLLEALLAVVVRCSWLPSSGRLLQAERRAYLEDRRIVQYDPECARYDEELAYTLRPGSCSFSNEEFSVRIDVNRLGLRDDEASLEAPEIVVLGDSFAMGWGVEQQETFAQQLEARTGLRVLTAAVASYATAREVLTLGRIDTSRLRLLVIQYCGDNDVDENRVFLEHGAQLPIMSRTSYEELARTHQGRSDYRFGLYLRRLVEGSPLTRGLFAAVSPPPSPHETESANVDARGEARLFLEVLSRAPVDLSHVPILVLELNGWGSLDDAFLDAVDAALAAGEAPRSGSQLRTLRLRKRLSARRDFYRLDDHLNALGHRKVADAIVEVLPELGIRAGP